VVTTHYVDEADRCTGVGFIQGGKLLAKGSPLALKRPLYGKLLEINVENVRDAMQILRRLPDVYGIELRNGRLRIQARDPEALLEGWLKHWPYAKLGWLGYTWVEPHMEDVFTVYSQGYHPTAAREPEKHWRMEGHISYDESSRVVRRKDFLNENLSC
jgi:ABC-2 type transport system ATP-binding protein